MKRIFSTTWLFVAVSACGGGSEPPAVRDPFIAFADDFKGFHGWSQFDVTSTAQPGTVHPDARLIEYLNKVPPHGSTAFPVGTIIVKEPTDGAPTDRKIFAGVKRGGGYNANGAPGWEWYELQNLGDSADSVLIVWSGVGPPAGDVYGGDPNAGCNTCHHDCGNDAVCAPALKLENF